MLTLVLPVRNWAMDRVEACLASFVAMGAPSLTEILVVDFGSEEPIVLPKGHDPMIKLVRLEASVWSLAEAINAGVLSASNDLIAKTDADILISPDSKDEFERMVAQLSAGRIGLGVCQATDLHQSLGVEQAREQVLAGKHPLGRLRAKWGQGGLVFFARDVWNAIGGFDSRFTGWGNEDNDFAERIRRSGRLIEWADQDMLQIFHVWHPPSHAATGILAHRQKNERIAQSDRSVLRGVAFRHSNFDKLATPAIRRAAAPLVTLGIATTARPNRERMIKEAIDSFRGQIDHDFEIMVVDNGSTDEEVAALRTHLGKIRWAQDLIRIEATPVASIPGARNIVTAEARGRYICVVDDDDIAFPTRLADHLRNFEGNGQLHGSHGGWIDFDEATGVIERNGGKARNAATLLRGTGKITAHPSSFYRTDAMRAVPYDESFALGSDLDLALRMATLGFEIGHTGTYVTLRRYHSTNVTITGTSNQASNGATARARALSTYGWTQQANLKKAAETTDGELYCRNQMSLDTLMDHMPDYTGEWQIYVPLAALSGTPAAVPAIANDESAVEAAATDTAIAVPDVSILGKLAEIVDGGLCTRRSGLNQPVFFRSAPIKSLKKARKVREQVALLLGRPIEMGSVRQAEIDRATPFQWKAIPTDSGARRLQSQRFSDLGDLLLAMAAYDRESLMVKTLSIVADYEEGTGEVYFLVTPSVKGYDEVRQLEHGLESNPSLHFHQVAGNGVQTELTLSARSH